MAARHQMEIPDWVWDAASVKWGCDNPASRLRDWISEKWAREEYTEARPTRRANGGTEITATYDSDCNTCGGKIREGERLLWQGRGKGGVCQRCLEGRKE